jgi:hypothetical protein
MKNQKLAQEILDFNKNAVKLSFEALGTFFDQTAKAADQLLEATPNVPDEGKKAFSLFIKENQKVQANLKNLVEANLEIDWTAKDAPVKGLEAMQSFYTSALSQSSAIQKETKDLLKKTTDQLPKEAKPVVDFWNETLNNNFQIFQSLMNKNFEVAKKVLADVSAEAPKASAKSDSK